MRIFTALVVYCNFLFILVCGHITPDYDAPQEITFYHDLENGEKETWTYRDKIKLHNINTANVDITMPRLSEDLMNKVKKTKVDRAFYRVKAVVLSKKTEKKVFYSFIKMDALIKSDFCTSTIVHLDQGGSVICVKMYPKNMNKSLPGTRYNSTITFKGSETGPVPDLSSYILKLEHERAAKEKQATQDNRSFLAKYWMYIVPLLMFVILSGSNADPGPAPGPGQGPSRQPQQNR